MARIKGFFTVVPASAGVILTGRFRSSYPQSRSRVSGGDPEWFRDENLIDRSFPRQRG